MSKLIIAGDTSKEKIDFAIIQDGKTLQEKSIKNKKSDLTSFVKSVLSIYSSLKQGNAVTEMFFVFEHTGIYNNIILDIIHNHNAKVALLHSGAIKSVTKVSRGKNDRLDALLIGEYAWRFYDKLEFQDVLDEDFINLKHLHKTRESLVKELSRAKAKLSENTFYSPEQVKINNEMYKPQIALFTKQIAAIDKKIEEVINANSEFKKTRKFCISVPGIGKVTAAALIVYTYNFTKFLSAKQLGSYCGVVPFERSSGAYKGRMKVSQAANKQLKTLLHLCALSAVQKSNPFGVYYKRKVEEDKKNKMSVLNAVRNKLLLAVFACVKNETLYDRNYAYSTAA